MPSNLYFTAYYTKGIKAVNMEQSAEIGATCAKIILEKDNYKIPMKYQKILKNSKYYKNLIKNNPIT